MAELIIQSGLSSPLVVNLSTLRTNGAVEYSLLAVGHLAAWDSTYARSLINADLAHEFQKLLEHWGNLALHSTRKNSHVSTYSRAGEGAHASSPLLPGGGTDAASLALNALPPANPGSTQASGRNARLPALLPRGVRAWPGPRRWVPTARRPAC